MIEAVEGLGEALVSGRTTAAACRVDEETLDAPGSDFLSASLVKNIAAGALKARAHIGGELDIEWGARDDEVFWLQARPITVTDEPDAFELDNTGVKDDDVVTTCNVGEMLPGAGDAAIHIHQRLRYRLRHAQDDRPCGRREAHG